MKRRILFALIASLLLTAFTSLFWLNIYRSNKDNILQRLNFADNTVSDLLFQKTGQGSRDIVVIGIDETSVPVLSRANMAKVLNILNADPASRPAVIGIDVLYTGEGSDPDADRQLVEAVSSTRNVVIASAAVIDNKIVSSSDSLFQVEQRSVISWDDPFPALREVSHTGLINAMEDPDGIFRHAMLYVDSTDRGRIFSFARAIYETWCKETGRDPLALPDTQNGFFYLPFSATELPYYDGITFSDLLSGSVSPDRYRGKIVLIGPYAVGLQDAAVTSADHARPMFGIDIHANTIEAFQKGFFPREVSPAPQLILLFLLLFFSALFFWKRHIIPSLLLWLGLSLGWVGFCKISYQSGHIFHVLWVPVCLTLLFLFSAAWNYIRTREEKRLVTETFGRYIDPAVMNSLLSEGMDALELGGKTCDIAVLFVDIRGFTTMSEALDAQTVVEILNRYLTLTTECIMKNHGTLDKFVGDCTMAVWNAPLPQEDPVYLACCAAMDMVEGSRTLGDELLSRFGRTVSFGVGVNWGPAVVGNIGAPRRMDYTAIGDTVNTAARLEANAPGGTVFISRSVADQLGDRAHVTSLGSSIKLKGKAEGFEILRLDALDR